MPIYELHEEIPLRWSSVSMFARCQRRYKFGYIEHLVRKPGPESRARILGSHIHAGIQAALQLNIENPAASQTDYANAAVAACRVYNHEHTEQGMTYRDYATGTDKHDFEYYDMMTAIVIQANHVLNYQVPRIGLGTKYRVAVDGDLFTWGEDTPMIEWNFHERFFWSVNAQQDGSNEYDITGTVDSVLQDLDTGEYLLVDWKSRGVMPQERLVDLDGQLKLYAAIINKKAGKVVIAHTCQYQVLTRIPQPVKLTEKKREVSKVVGSTTWEVWSASLKTLKIDPADYEELREKMHAASWFTNPIFTPVTPFSSRAIIRNVLNWGEAIRAADRGDSFPALPSITGCQFCDFKSLCNVVDNGGDERFIKQVDYMPGDPDGDTEMEEAIELGE